MTKAQLKKRIVDMLIKLSDVQNELDHIIRELQDNFDSKSKRWQEGTKGVESQSMIDQMTELHNGTMIVADAINELDGDESVRSIDELL